MRLLRHPLRDDGVGDGSRPQQAYSFLPRDYLAPGRHDARNLYEVDARDAGRLHRVLGCDPFLLVSANAAGEEHAARDEQEWGGG
jgi:hypothetical protein